MMKLDKKNILISLAVLIVVVLLVVAAFLLVRGIMQFNDSEAKLVVAKQRLQELYDKKPFSSQPNVNKEKENVAILNEWFLKLTAVLRKGQIEPVQKSPSTFMSLLQGMKPELIRQANEFSKVVSDDFGFGFERYLDTSSALPEPNDVPRLTQQLTIIEKLCGVLFSEKIEQLSVLQREVFETGPDAGAASPGGSYVAKAKAGVAPKLVNKGAGLLGEEDLYAKLHFIVEFKAMESVVLNIMNKLANHEMFIVVSSVDIKKEGSGLDEIRSRITASVAPATSQLRVAAPSSLSNNADPFDEKPVVADNAKSVSPAPGEQSTKPVAAEKRDREARIVCGPELEKAMNIKIELDVYRFREE